MNQSAFPWTITKIAGELEITLTDEPSRAGTLYRPFLCAVCLA
jgi:hypothetical protein